MIKVKLKQKVETFHHVGRVNPVVDKCPRLVLYPPGKGSNIFIRYRADNAVRYHTGHRLVCTWAQLGQFYGQMVGLQLGCQVVRLGGL